MISWENRPGICVACSKPSTKESKFCDKCVDEENAYFEIDFPLSWIKRLKGTEKGKVFTEIKAFSCRHNYKIGYVLAKMNLAHGFFVELNSIELKELVSIIENEPSEAEDI